MTCPKCKSQKVQPVTSDGNRLYCVDCNYAWKKENGKNEHEGNLNFEGFPKARQIFDALTKGQSFTPEFRAALESQISAIILDQWFEGFKAGQMASILYAKEHYGKDRNDSLGTTNSRGGRTAETTSPGKNSKRKRIEDPANPRTARPDFTVKERVNGIIVEHPGNVRCPDNMFEEIAKVSEKLDMKIKKFAYDGHSLNAELDW